MGLKARVLSTMKSRETESHFELYVTRTPGYLWALLFRTLHIHPIAVTLASIVIGAASGYYFGQESLIMNMAGMLLLIWANWYDCADGQLARMTGQRTLIGRILDGFAGDVWFFSIYVFLCLRLTPTCGVWIWILASWAGFHCHGKQCAIADYYRNIHLWLLLGKEGSELDTSEQERNQMLQLNWCSQDWFHKLYLYFYCRYTRGQERQTPEFQRLYRYISKANGGTLPQEMRERFRQDSLPLMPLTNILTFDTRAGVLFLSLFIGYPWVYFVFEATILEWMRTWMIGEHERFSRQYYQELTSQ